MATTVSCPHLALGNLSQSDRFPSLPGSETRITQSCGHVSGSRGHFASACERGPFGQRCFLRRAITMLATMVEVIKLSNPPMRMSIGIRIDGQLAMARNVGTM